MIDKRDKETIRGIFHYALASLKNVLCYIRWTILQRIFWKASARGYYKISDFIRNKWYHALHDFPKDKYGKQIVL